MSHVKHLVLPGYELARRDILEGETVDAFLERAEWQFKLPTICVMNGLPVLRKEWETTTISDRDNVVFYSKPYGGNSSGGSKWKMVAGVVALIALAAFAPWAAGALGLTGFLATAFTAAVTMAGGLLIASFLQTKAASNDEESISQIYSISAAGNTATPFQTIPVHYGRLKIIPQYAAIPWTDFIGNDAYLNVLLCNGQGKYDREQILIDDTILWDSTTGISSSFTDVSYQFCDPGEPFTLFPSNVVSSSEVSGQEVTVAPVGYFIVNNAGTVADKIIFDFVFPAGCRYTADDGQHFNETVHIEAWIQQINNVGTPIGAETKVIDEFLDFNTPQPTRLSRSINLVDHSLPNGRYQAKAQKYPASDVDPDHQTNTMNWESLRAYLEGSNVFDHCSVTGIRIKAGSQLSQNSAKQFGLIQTRILPVWNGTSMVEQTTKSPWWAFYDAATNQDYGAKWPLNKVDFQTIVDQAAAAASRGDYFNYRFDSAVTFQSAFDTILQSSRAKVTWLGDVLSATRDEWQAVPQMLLSDQQIIRGSLEVDFILNSEDSADCVQGQFLNEETWQPASLQYPPESDDFQAENPSAIELKGITDADQLFRELRFYWKQSQLRRIKVRLDTEHDGRLLRFGSAAKVQSFLPKKWGASGEIVSYNSGTHTLTISRSDLDVAEPGQHFIELRSKTGGYFGPVKCSFGAQPNKIVLDLTDLTSVEADLGMTISQAMDRMDGAEPPAFVWGLEGNLSRNCIVLSGRPSGSRVSLELVVDSEEVHDDTGFDQPDLPTPPPYADPRSPIVYGLIASLTQNVSEATLSATWWPSKGALYYKAQISYDEGLTWTTVADSLSEPNLTVTTAYSDLRLRVAAIGFLQGAWTSVDVEAPTLTGGNTPVTPDDLSAGLRDYLMNRLNTALQDLTLVTQQIASVAAETDAAQTKNGNVLRQVASNAFAQVSALATVVANNQLAFASYQLEVSATFGPSFSSVSSVSTALATTDGIVNAMFSLTLNVNGYISGYSSINTGSSATFVVQADHFIIATAGQTPRAVFDVGTVGGVASLGMKGNFMLDGTITAQALNVVTLSSITADIGTVTAGVIRSSDSKFIIDLTNKKMTISD